MKKNKEVYIQTINLLFCFSCLNKFPLSDSNGSHTTEKLSRNTDRGNLLVSSTNRNVPVNKI